MTIYIAMLRGINVSGHRIIKMEALRASFTALGFCNVKTYVQSGNVLFETNDPPAALPAKIEKRILADFGHEVPTVTKTAKEMADIVGLNPFVKDKAIDQSRLYVTFLSNDPPKNALELLQSLATGAEQVRVAGRAVYLYLPIKYNNTKLSNATIEKKLSCRATTRNWKTAQTLLEMAQGGD
jgi:uncharacterized protein (DUF1697 family)